MTDRELMQQALEALEWWETGFGEEQEPFPIITALRERLAQPEQEPEPVAWFDKEFNSVRWRADLRNRDLDDQQPLYTTPPRREWVGLTMDDMADLAVSKEWLAGARWAEAKLREKNAQ